MELLIIIGLIAVLAGMILLYARPGERILKARDDHREVHLNTIYHAVEIKIDQDKGAWANCNPIPEDAMTLISSDYYDLYSCIIPDHLGEPLFDPLIGHYNSAADYNTKYRIWRNPLTGAVSLRAEGETRLVYSGDPEPPMKLAIGEECDIGTDCESNYCSEGYCCNTACSAACWACNIIGFEGTCTALAAGALDAACSEDGVSCIGNCNREKYDGRCDGAGSCRIVQENISIGYVCTGGGAKTVVSSDYYCGTSAEVPDCEPGDCAGPMITPYFSCSGAGSCRTEYDSQYDAGDERTVYASQNYVLTDNCQDSAEMASADTCQWCQGEGQAGPAFQFYDSRGSGQLYQTVLIGSQCWMSQNMNVGTMINGINNQGSGCVSIDKYCYGDSSGNCDTDGGLYQWDQAMCGSVVAGDQGICPVGWHIPTNADWDALVSTVGSNPGTKLQSGGSSGFEGKLAGHRNLEGAFAGRGEYAGFWSSNQYVNQEIAWYRSLYKDDPNFYELLFDKNGGFSVRCLLD